MRINRPVGRHEEPVEFRPLPGQEADWAGADYLPREPIWLWLGVYPIGAAHVMLLLLMGMVAL